MANIVVLFHISYFSGFSANAYWNIFCAGFYYHPRWGIYHGKNPSSCSEISVGGWITLAGEQREEERFRLDMPKEVLGDSLSRFYATQELFPPEVFFCLCRIREAIAIVKVVVQLHKFIVFPLYLLILGEIIGPNEESFIVYKCVKTIFSMSLIY